MPGKHAEASNLVFNKIDIVATPLTMKILTNFSRFLLAVIFGVFGLNGFFHVIPLPLPSGVAAQFMGAMCATKYLLVVFALELIPGVSLLVNRFVPLALALLAPVIVNILLYHTLINPAGLGFAIFVTILWGAVFASVRSEFAGIFQARVGSTPSLTNRQSQFASYKLA
jgi:putative oxidoreductase